MSKFQRLSMKNKRKMFYSLLIGEVPIYEKDQNGNKISVKDSEGNPMVDSEGNVIYIETGQYELAYAIPIEFAANISMGSGETKTVEYGIDVSAYDAVVLTGKNLYPISETSLIWFGSEIKYKDEEKTIVDPNSADYKVVAVKDNLNYTKYILAKLVK